MENCKASPAREGEALGSSMREWQGALIAKADFPETQLVLAGIGLTTRRMETALRAFEEAVNLDPQLEEGWVMMVRIHAALGNSQAARDVADRAVEANPESINLNLLRSDLY
jgi:cytochrome c-type biogenesis protein CcmH/NrfG